MSGDEPDQLTINSRRGLLDALVALEAHRDRLVLVGAHAVYLHTRDVVIGVALRTKDADIAVIPPLEGLPDLEATMRAAKFEPGSDPGIWLSEDRQVDLLVPESLAPRDGRRGARLPGHGARSARKVPGLEGAAVDNDVRDIAALDIDDHRVISMHVAGPAALLVSKLYKLDERHNEPGERRLLAKDALDAYRLLRLPALVVAAGFDRMRLDAVSAPVALRGTALLRELFAPRGFGTELAGQAVLPPDAEFTRASVVALAGELGKLLDDA